MGHEPFIGDEIMQEKFDVSQNKDEYLEELAIELDLDLLANLSKASTEGGTDVRISIIKEYFSKVYKFSNFNSWWIEREDNE